MNKTNNDKIRYIQTYLDKSFTKLDIFRCIQTEFRQNLDRIQAELRQNLDRIQTEFRQKLGKIQTIVKNLNSSKYI